MENTQKIIDVKSILVELWKERYAFLKVWTVVFVLSCIWIFPQPRYYNAQVKLAPEIAGETSLGGIASLASSFGVNLGGAGNDAIYPVLYPDLFESPEFIAELMTINVKTKDGSLDTDYYTYMKKHQKQNPLTKPFFKTKKFFESVFGKEEETSGTLQTLDPFQMSKKDFMLLEKVKKNIKCSVDKKTDVTTILVVDQDPLVCAMLANSVRLHLQDFIIQYRTSKYKQDVEYYSALTEKSKTEYEQALKEYSRYCDTHKNVVMQTSISERDKLENTLSMKLNAFQTIETQLEMVKAKVQEKTPAFTVLQSATVPVKAAGPKRMVFVAAMLILSTFCMSIWILKRK